MSSALKNSLTVVETYPDAAMSGGSMMGCDGLFNLLADARTGKFDTIIVESLDRLSRDMGDLADIHKRLTFCGVEIATLNEGVANTITIGLRGIIGQLYREDLAQKTRRGMRGKVSGGLSAGGRSYGYDLHPRNKGELTINETEADTVRRIFTEYAGGIIVEIQGNLRHLLGDKGPDVKSWDAMVAGARFGSSAHSRATSPLSYHLRIAA